MAEMSMNKAIHGAVRRDLRRFVDALGAFPPGDTARAKQLHAAWSNFADQLHHHHTDEHAIAWPALVSVGVPRDTISTMDEEHEAMAAALDEAGAAMERLSRAPNVGESRAALAAVKQLRDGHRRPPRPRGGGDRAGAAGQARQPRAEGDGARVRQGQPGAGRTLLRVGPRRRLARRAGGVKGEVPGPVLAIIGGIFGLGYRRRVAPAWR